MNYKKRIFACISIIAAILLFFFALIVLPYIKIAHLKNFNFLEKFVDMLFLFIPILVAYILYVQSERDKETQRLREEINSINITLKEIKKNNEWCKEFIAQGIQPSIKFYNLTAIGIERCLNTLRFNKEDEFLEAFYMTIKLVKIVNNIIEAIIITKQNFNANLVNMSNESIKESKILESYLLQRRKENIKLIKKL